MNLIPLLPEIILALSAMALLVAGVMRGNVSTAFICRGAIVVLLLVAVILLGLDWERQEVLNGMFVMDRFAGLVKLLILGGLIAALALTTQYLYQDGIVRFEYPVLVLLAGLGMLMMVSAHNLLSLYVGLELQSLSLYILAAIRKDNAKSAEAGIKYFVLGALSSGMLLFGMSLFYGYTGSLNFSSIAAVLEMTDKAPAIAVIGMVFMLSGLAFKISAVPFHMWTPDVYEGAPTSVTALFAIVPKLAAMALLIRLLFEPFAAAQVQWTQIIWFLSAASMTVGAFAAIAQKDIKRLMAYSSIGHMGYALIGVVSGGADGVGAVLVYMAIYMIMGAGTFAVILSMRRGGIACEHIGDLAGLSRTSPLLAYAMAILMFSMSGIPPLAGFFGKLLIFQAAVESGFYVLAVFGVLTSVVAAYYYLRIIKLMFFDEAADRMDGDIGFARRIVMLVSVVALLGFAVSPDLLVETGRAAAASLFPG